MEYHKFYLPLCNNRETERHSEWREINRKWRERERERERERDYKFITVQSALNVVCVE